MGGKQSLYCPLSSLSVIKKFCFPPCAESGIGPMKTDEGRRADDGAPLLRGSVAEGVLDSIKDGVTLADREYRLVYVNRAVLDSFGFKSREEVLGRICHEVFFERDEPCEWCRCKACFETGEPQHNRVAFQGDDGVTRYYDLHTYPYFEGGEVTHVIEVAKDVTEEANLLSELERLAAIADSSADAMMSVDLEGRVVFWNKGAESLFGYQREEILGRHYHVIVPEELRDEAEEMRKEALKAGFVRNYETYRLRKDGAEVPVNITLSLVRDEKGNPAGIAGNMKDLTEMKRLEEDYRNLFENARDGISITDREGTLVLFNPQFIEMTGYSEKELRGMHLSKLIHPRDRERVLAYNRRLMAGKDAPRSYEFRMLRKDGRVMDVEVTASPIVHKGEIVGTQGILRDMSERGRMELEIIETKRHLETVLDTIEEAICVIDPELRIISFNEAFAENVSTPRDEILGKTCYEVLHGYGEKEFKEDCMGRCIVREAFETGRAVESVHHHEADGYTLYHESRALPSRDHLGEVMQVVYVVKDITEKKEMERALQESEEKYRSVVESSPDMIFLVDRRTGVIVDVNRAATQLLGYSKEEIIGTVSGSRVVPSQRKAYEEQLERLRKTGSYKGEFDVQKKGGGVVTVEVRGALLGDYMVTIGRDVTERRKAERMLREYASELEHSNRMKDLFSDIMRHDLLNPLGVIKNVCELLSDDLKKTGAEEELRILRRNLDKIEDLIDSATRFAMVESAEELEFEPADLVEILHEVLETLKGAAAEKDIDIRIPEGEFTAEVNPFIEDVFSNLISNAIKYSPQGGDVTVEIDDRGDVLAVTVADRGPGVPDEHKKSVFERFKRAEKGSVKGSGLGLAIVKKVVELHKGEVWIEDNPGGGSRFIFTLPKRRGRDV
ncbi:MAG: PAS domain S-box protein [Methanobacteriota archaeon]|nr:MAG: PAS domain S-box protein [Euryarchaeota archaeon]